MTLLARDFVLFALVLVAFGINVVLSWKPIIKITSLINFRDLLAIALVTSFTYGISIIKEIYKAKLNESLTSPPVKLFLMSLSQYIQIICFNPPYYLSVKTNIGGMFFKFIENNFP